MKKEIRIVLDTETEQISAKASDGMSKTEVLGMLELAKMIFQMGWTQQVKPGRGQIIVPEFGMPPGKA